MKKVKYFLEDIGVPYREKDSTLFLPGFSCPSITITKVETPDGMEFFRVVDIDNNVIVDELIEDDAGCVAFFMYFITRIRTGSENLDNIVWHGYRTMIKYLTDTNKVLRQNRKELLEFITEKLLPLTKEINDVCNKSKYGE